MIELLPTSSVQGLICIIILSQFCLPAHLHLQDVDCFYAQTEILQRPHLKERPVAVVQKHLIVTCNYVARSLGVNKVGTIEEAKQRCPDLVIFNGEDLSPYRAASKRIMEVLKRFGVLERRGLDECAVDITQQTKCQAALDPSVTCFSGYVVGCNARDMSNEGRRFQFGPPLTAIDVEQDNEVQIVKSSARVDPDTIRAKNVLLMIGSQIVAKMREAIEKETGYQCSAGIAHNKMLAKLVCSVNKPNKQTCILQSAVLEFLSSLSIRKVPGIGHHLEAVLKEMGVTTIMELRELPLDRLTCKFGDKIGSFLYNACRGWDSSPVQDKGPFKSLSVEDSFKPCTTFGMLKEHLASIAGDLIFRLDEDNKETGRRPKHFTVKWRSPGNWKFSSTSTEMPSEVLSTSLPFERRTHIIVETGMRLLSQNLRNCSFSIVVLNIGATNFKHLDTCLSTSFDIRSYLSLPGASTGAIKKQEVTLHHSNGEVDTLEPSATQGDQLPIEKSDVCTTACTTAASLSPDEISSTQSRKEIQILDLDLTNSHRFSVMQSERSCLSPEAQVRDNSASYYDTSNDPSTSNGRSLKVESEESFLVKVKDAAEQSAYLLEAMFTIGSHGMDDTCKKCGQAFDQDNTKREHIDYHLALDLQAEENVWKNLLSKQEHSDYEFAVHLARSENAIFEPSRNSTTHQGRLICPSRKRKPSIQTLDRFVKR